MIDLQPSHVKLPDDDRCRRGPMCGVRVSSSDTIADPSHATSCSPSRTIPGLCCTHFRHGCLVCSCPDFRAAPSPALACPHTAPHPRPSHPRPRRLPQSPRTDPFHPAPLSSPRPKRPLFLRRSMPSRVPVQDREAARVRGRAERGDRNQLCREMACRTRSTP